MGKIDKEKLLNVLKKHFPNYKDYKVIAELELAKNAIELVENFPEEPEIDFDDLYNEWCKNTKDWSELRSPYDQARSLRDFLKSKNLTVPKSVDIPVKKTWTLKKHVKEIFYDFGNTPYPRTSDPPENLKKYYDPHEEPDYSKIPKGSIVEIECLGDKFYRTFVKFEHENIFTKDGEEIEQWSPDVIIRVVELAKEKLAKEKVGWKEMK